MLLLEVARSCRARCRARPCTCRRASSAQSTIAAFSASRARESAGSAGSSMKSDVVVAVADVADDRRRRRPARRAARARVRDRRRRAPTPGRRRRSASCSLPGARGDEREAGVVPRLPEPRARRRVALDLERVAPRPRPAPAAPRGRRRPPRRAPPNSTKRLGASASAVPLYALTRAHRLRVEQLEPRDARRRRRPARRRAARRLDVRERDARGDGVLGDPVQAQRQLGDHAERPLGADEERGQVVAGRRLAARGCPVRIDAAVGEHDLEREHVRAHAAVADGRRAARVRRRHAAERRVGAGVDRELEPVRGRAAAFSASRVTPGCTTAVEVAGRDARRSRSSRREVEADAAAERDHVALEARAGAERHDGHALARSRTRAPRATSSVDSGKTTTSGRLRRVVA